MTTAHWKRINETVIVPRWRCTTPGCGRVVTWHERPGWPCDRCGGGGEPGCNQPATDLSISRARRVAAATWEDVEGLT